MLIRKCRHTRTGNQASVFWVSAVAALIGAPNRAAVPAAVESHRLGGSLPLARARPAASRSAGGQRGSGEAVTLSDYRVRLPRRPSAGDSVVRSAAQAATAQHGLFTSPIAFVTSMPRGQASVQLKVVRQRQTPSWSLRISRRCRPASSRESKMKRCALTIAAGPK